ncbi:hypothetical protein GALL_35590 [mine drainage metagenome]|uniref:Uncharacterized protein n=1 Tax=mine drainage metagenome TaxID=410659 RepID=A0A1J5T5C4_9ZZZZ
MPESDKSPLNWDIELNFDSLEIREKEPPVTQKIPPRQVIGEKFPKILERIELLWCSLELHKYLEQTLFTDRSNRQGFPKEVMQALGEIHIEHTRILKLKKIISEDVWDI